MALYRRAARRDVSETGIIAALSALGCSVEPLSGRGTPDLLVGLRGRMLLMECKSPAGPRGGVSGRGLTPDQVEWHRRWKGPPVVIARTVEDAIRAAMIEFEIYGDLVPVSSRFDTGEP